MSCRLDEVFRAARELNLVFAGRESDLFAIRAIDLGMKGKIRRQPFGLRRINVLAADRES